MKILLACGGTGGHIFPAFSVAEEIRKNYPQSEIVYVCGKKDIENEIFRLVSGQKVVSIESAPYRGMSSFVNPAFLSQLAGGFKKSLKLVKEEKPLLVAGFGGHYSFPVILAAKFLGVPTMIHEQNASPGTANKVLARIADKVALTYNESKKYFAKNPSVRVTGNPIRASIEKDHRAEGYAYFGFDAKKKTVLVLGGSQGSESINKIFLSAMHLMDAKKRSQIQVLHLCGKMIPEEVVKVYADMGIKARAFSFFERMDLAYSVTQLAVGRAGATFLAEISAKKIPAILIPYPFAGQHQLANAKAFCLEFPGLILEQQGLTAEVFLKSFEDYLLSAKILPDGNALNVQGVNSRTQLMNFMMETIDNKS